MKIRYYRLTKGLTCLDDKRLEAGTIVEIVPQDGPGSAMLLLPYDPQRPIKTVLEALEALDGPLVPTTENAIAESLARGELEPWVEV
jgi:hypothetical protein